MNRVLVVYKKSAYQLHMLERRDAHLRGLLRRRHPDVLDMQQAHRVHQQTLAAVTATLRRLGAAADLVYRADLKTTARYDLVVSVGGDGTVLQASHVVADTPLLGVNSDPRRSEAVFCAATKATIGAVLRCALARPPGWRAGEGTLPMRRLWRLAVRLNGRRAGLLALNDVLIAHEDPATMSRYRLKIGARQEPQKSSGLWVATAAGSSSAILAAGGKRLTWTSPQFQYKPRELYQGRLTDCRLTGGVLPMGRRLEVTWLMREGKVYVDGPHVRLPLRFGDRLVIELSPDHPLHLLGGVG